MELERDVPRYPGLSIQPDPHSISQKKLASEARIIYAGLRKVETKCLKVDRAQAAMAQSMELSPRLPSNHWQALIDLYRTLLHEHDDFFLASGDSSTDLQFKKRIAEHHPARMWRHGSQSFPDLTRRSLPDSDNYLPAFEYPAYQMTVSLHETVPVPKDSRTNSLGDLGRYRMAMEDEEIRDRATWADSARFWYIEAAKQNSCSARLNYRQAILSRHDAVCHCSSIALVYLTPSGCAHDSVSVSFVPLLVRSSGKSWRCYIFLLNQKLLLQVKRNAGNVVLTPCILLDTGLLNPYRPIVRQGLNKYSKAFYQILEQMLHSSLKVLAQFLEFTWSLLYSHRHIFAEYLYAGNMYTASAAGEPAGNSTLSSSQAPMIHFETTSDFAILGIMIVYLLVMLALRLKTSYSSTAFRVSYALMVGTGIFNYFVNRDEVASPIRSTVLETWFITSLHVVIQYCYDNYNPALHIASFFIIAILFSIVLHEHPALNPLVILPPYVSLIALALWAIHTLESPKSRKQPLTDVEHGQHAVELFDRSLEIQNPRGVDSRYEDSAMDSPGRLVSQN